jgi:hypothetical protein
MVSSTGTCGHSGSELGPVSNAQVAELFALVANRALDPVSKLAATEWVAGDVAISGLEAMSDNRRTGRWTCWWS